MDGHLINEIAVCIVAAWLLAGVAQLLRQPLVLAYLVAGFIIGPRALGWVQDQQSISTISEMGLILLLFMIGLEIDLRKIIGAGRLILVTAAAQILGGFFLGLLFFRGAAIYYGGTSLEAVYLAVAVTLSSTVILIKLLYDKRELDTAAGRLTVGVLVLQDLFAIFFLALQPDLRSPALGVLAVSLGKVGIIIVVAFPVSRFVLPPLFNAVARLPELVQVGALAWCFLVAGLASILGLSREMGALIAGVALSTFPYTLDVVAKVTSLRDFFVTLFFVALGMEIPAPSWYFAGWSLAIGLFLVISRLTTVFPPLHWMRQGHRVSVGVGLHLSQVSEFSLVIMALGMQAGHVTEKIAGIVSYTFVLTAVVSTYAILRSDLLFRVAVGWLNRIGLPDLGRDKTLPAESGRAPEVFLLGFSWTASSLLEEIRRRDPRWLERLAVIDFNPQVYAKLTAQGVRIIYGDISQRETLAQAGAGQAEILVSTLPNTVLKGTDNLRLLQQLRELNRSARIIVHAELLEEVPRLYAAGADYVTVPRLLEAVELLAVMRAADRNMLAEKRAALDRELADRHEVIP